MPSTGETKKRLAFVVSVLCLFLALLAPDAGESAVIDTSFRFSTIETEHFSIHFHNGLEDAAEKAAVIAERAHERLAPQFKWTPAGKTQIVLIDDSDFANGYASVLPYNVIYAQVIAPSLDTTIGEYDDWLETIITHEYTHILTMDPARGVSRVTRLIFGKTLPGMDILSLITFIATAPPNVFLPRWWLEGVATWAETEYGKAGRGRSTYYGMILRSAVAEDNIPTIAQVTGGVPYWPDGHNPYIFGMRLQKYIADKYGNPALGDLNMTHAGRFPYFLNGAPERLFKGKNYVTLYKEMIAELKRDERDEIEILKQTPLTPFTALSIKGELLTNPRLSPDGGRIAYNRRDPHEHEAIFVANKDGTNAREVCRRVYSDHAISWSPEGDRLYFSQAVVVNGFNLYSDLYSCDASNGRSKRLTTGLRVSEPDVSPDGKTFAVIVSNRGNRNFALLRFDGQEPILETLTDFKLQRVSGPRWSPDGSAIVYAVTDNEGTSGLNLYSIKDRSTKTLVKGGHDIAYPAWSRDGRYVVYISDENGVFNIFSYSMEDGVSRRTTHLTGGALQPDITPDGNQMIFSNYTSRGWRIAVAPFNAKASVDAPHIRPYPKWGAQSDNKRTESNEPPLERKGDETMARPYSALDTIAPRFWLPTLSGDAHGAVLGAFTVGQDVLGYNTYSLELARGLSSAETYYDMYYRNDYLYPSLFARSYIRPALYSDMLERGDYYEKRRGFVIGASVPINRVESYYRLIAGWHMQRQNAASELVNGRFNGLQVFEGRRDYVFAGLGFSTSLKYPYSISHEEGTDAELIYRYYSRRLGSDVHSKEFIASLSEYYLVPFAGRLRRSVLYLNIKGGASSGDVIAQQAFQLGGTDSLADFPLRGYKARSSAGKYAGTATLEWRAPFWYMFRGVNTKPFFMDSLHGALFTDGGEVWDDSTGFSTGRLKVGVGAELRLDLKLGYLIEITPALGVAKGLTENGATQIYFTIHSNL
ncbi:MAG: PD40 domain-containing protein [Deltaproteobacteria bacterium]|nr:PD40 domain-containing protein [Deltaproteobacteria bacterium]